MNRSLILFFFFDDEEIFFDDEDDPDDTDEFARFLMMILTRFSLLATGERLFLGGVGNAWTEEADGDSVVLMGVSVEVRAIYMLESVVLLELELCNLGLLSPSSLS